MDRHSYNRLAEIVGQVLEAQDQERASHLRALCGEDEELFEAASRLLSLTEAEEGAFNDAALNQQRARLDELIDSFEAKAAGTDEEAGTASHLGACRA